MSRSTSNEMDGRRVILTKFCLSRPSIRGRTAHGEASELVDDQSKTPSNRVDGDCVVLEATPTLSVSFSAPTLNRR